MRYEYRIVDRDSGEIDVDVWDVGRADSLEDARWMLRSTIEHDRSAIEPDFRKGALSIERRPVGPWVFRETEGDG